MTIDDIKKYEAMAKLDLDAGTRQWAADAISSMEGGWKELREADARGASPLVNVLGTRNALREDVAAKKFQRDSLLALAPEERDGYFQAPRVMD